MRNDELDYLLIAVLGGMPSMAEAWELDSGAMCFRVARGRAQRDRADRVWNRLMSWARDERQREHENELRRYPRYVREVVALSEFGGLRTAVSPRPYNGIARVEAVPEELIVLRKRFGLSIRELARRVADQLGLSTAENVRGQLRRLEIGQTRTLPVDVRDALEAVLVDAESRSGLRSAPLS